jgi:hypothetical protein
MNRKLTSRFLVLVTLLNILCFNGNAAGPVKPLIFPVPSEIKLADGKFAIDKSTFILLPQDAGKNDIFLAQLLLSEFVDKYEQSVAMAKRSAISDKEKFILIGDVSNPLVKKYCDQKGITASLKGLGDEGYMLSVTPENVVVVSNTRNGALYGLESLRQIITEENGKLFISQLTVKDSPRYPFRGIKLYLPGRENITFFKRFVKDFVALYKFNKIILELNANMRLDKHPELNIGAVQFERHLRFSRLDRPPGQHMEYQNSSHQDNADGGILEKEEVADLVSYIRKFNIEVIPELPSLTHSYYLLAGHEELAENPNQPYPDTYCPLRPGSYQLYFDVLDEYIDVIHPSIIHIGHDEWRMEKDICELCKGKDYGQLYADDVTKIHDYLAKKGIKIALWGDHLLESVTEKEFQTWKSSAGYQYKIPGALKPEQVLKLIPKDVLVFNWFWDDIKNDKQVSDFGFQQVYGNFRADIDKWSDRYNIKGVLGGAPSSWAATTEKNFGKDQMVDFLGSSNLLWSTQYIPFDKLSVITESLVDDIYYRFSGIKQPSNTGSKVTALDISAYFNSSLAQGVDSISSNNLIAGQVRSGNRIFNLPDVSGKNLKGASVSIQKIQSKPKTVRGIQVNSDPNSIIFLHACTKEGNNKKAYDMIYDFDETSELIGWYEVVYDDGFMVTIPVRYGVNILDWRWYQRITGFEKPKAKYSQNQYAYNATAVLCSKENTEPVTFFSYEWVNPRLGKQIKEINLKSANYGKNNENAIILLGISVAENSKKVAAKGTERQ